MSNTLNYHIELCQSKESSPIFVVTASRNEQVISLSKSTFMLFLFEHEKSMPAGEAEFAYKLIQMLRKVRKLNDIEEALTDTSSIVSFFFMVRKYGVPVTWKHNQYLTPVRTNDPIPLTLTVKRRKHILEITMNNREEWRREPFGWQEFKSEKGSIGFSYGTVLINPPQTLKRLLQFFRKNSKLTLTENEAPQFIRQTINANKKNLNWNIQTNLNHFLPHQVEPKPILRLEMTQNMLSPRLSYKYESEEISPENQDPIVLESKTGKKHKRMVHMEDAYQKKLMEYFTEHNLPFLLVNPGDIATFLDKLVPILKEDGWEIISNVKEFHVFEEPLDLIFSLTSNSTQKDWFSFEPNCDISGQNFSLEEIARLMVQNHGYIKTESGYLKLSEKTQKDLQNLARFNAFNEEQKFSRQDILPLLLSTNIQGQSEDARSLIDKIKALDKPGVCKPDPSFKAILRDYQQFGINWIQFLFESGLGGILADDMGLGKTIQALAFASQLKDPGTTLIVGPTNVIYNWEQEISKWMPGSKVVMYSGPHRHQRWKEMPRPDFLITSFGVVKNDIDIMSAVPFKCIFIDEAQFIKNPQTQVSKAIKRLQGGFRLVMTGTPIENHMTDLWNLFDFVLPNYLDSMTSFENQLKNGGKDMVKTKIKPFILRREKMEVLDSLPAKTEITLKCPLTPAQQKLYETVLKVAKEGIRNSMGKSERLNILTALLKLRQVCIHPGLLKEFDAKELESSKFEVLKAKISELMEENHKAVVFSQFTEMLDIVQEWLQLENIYFERIDGSVEAKERLTATNRFQANEKPGVFLLSLKAGGIGINLTAADYVFHLDPWWNPAIEAQATDRVHRIGQTKKVMVYKLITSGTIEEKILALQEEKQQLFFEMIEIDKEQKKIDIDMIKELINQ